ncbi:Helicase associated domain protein [Streptomyces sp. NPDC056454]|uniref:Helicase associated domain protein n=1 Tax=Streptomyces sp. NPDC056454 TaxID=3345823 RepID=UPI00368EE03D
MADHGLKKVLVYFNLTSDARLFARELPHTLRQLAATAPHLVPATQPETLFVHGEDTPPQQREETFTRFAHAHTAILTNARLVAEGVDLPSVDAVVFADPTRSVVRCVQALGRALRLDVSGKTASLIVLVCLPPDASPEDILGSAYEPVWAIASALASHDHRILERLPDKANRLPKETSDVIERRWHFDFTVRPERIAQAMDLVSFDPRDPTTSRSRRHGLAAAQAYHDQYSHLDVPADYIDPTGHTLGTFITTMRDARKAGRLEADWVAELDALDMIWDKHHAAWRSRLTAAADHHRAYGHLAVPATTPLGAWLAEQRHLDAAGQLTPARTDALTAIDPDWRLPHGAGWHRKYHLLRTHLQAGNDPTALTPDTRIAGVNIPSWLTRQLTRWATLHPGQRDLLTALDLTPTTNPLTPAPSPRPCNSWNSSSTATAAPPPPAKPSASTATPSRSAPGSPRPAPSTATATSPPTTQPSSLPSSTETGAPPTPPRPLRRRPSLQETCPGPASRGSTRSNRAPAPDNSPTGPPR